MHWSICKIAKMLILCNVMCNCFSSGRGNFDMAPIDTWTNEKTVNGDKDVSIGGMHVVMKLHRTG